MIKIIQNMPIVKGQLECDRCGEILARTQGKDLSNVEFELQKIGSSYRDLNNGHECRFCKKQRERSYDNFVDPLCAYH